MSQALDQKQVRWERAAQLAHDVLEECRVQLMLKFRFLDLALWRMPLSEIAIEGRYPISTDAKSVYFEPYGMLRRFDQTFDEVVRDYLHLTLHCIFRHPFDKNHSRHEAWWLACDIVTESVAMDMCGDRFPSEDDGARRSALAELEMLTSGKMMPGTLYTIFERAMTAPAGTSYQGIDQGKLSELADLFERDAHETWPAFAQSQIQETPGDVEELSQPDQDPSDAAPDAMPDQLLDDQGTAQQNESDSGANSKDDDGSDGEDDAEDIGEDGPQSIEVPNMQSDGSDDESSDDVREESEDEREWEELAKQVEMNLETFSKEWGEQAGSLIQALAVANRKRFDYADFLRRFTVMSEEMKINDDEYDYIFYTYGLELYGNMPLVEPLEYKETQRIRDFVIAIDTSESCSGDLVRAFVERTFSIIKESETFGSEVNIHVIQCDAKVQADTKITDLRDVDVFMEGFFVRGFGGTDFRPAFAYVNQLLDRGEFNNLKGIIYFTDGLGQYPEKAPDYDAAFVFMDTGERFMPSVPPWAMRVIIDEEGINRFKSGV